MQKTTTMMQIRIWMMVVVFIFVVLMFSSVVYAKEAISIRLDGIDDEVVVKDSYYLDGYSEATWNVWLKQYEYVDKAGILGKYMTGEDNRAYIIRTALNNSISFVVSSEGFDTTLATSISKKRCGIRENDKWTMITLVFNSSHVLYYHDGVLCDTDKVNIPSIHNSPKLLRFGGANDRFFNGEIDDFRLYSIALSDSQIAQLYDAKIRNNSDDRYFRKHIVGQWLMDEGRGSIARDNSHYKNTAYLLGGASWIQAPFEYGPSLQENIAVLPVNLTFIDENSTSSQWNESDSRDVPVYKEEVIVLRKDALDESGTRHLADAGQDEQAWTGGENPFEEFTYYIDDTRLEDEALGADGTGSLAQSDILDLWSQLMMTIETVFRQVF